jgi:hypothetical protein
LVMSEVVEDISERPAWQRGHRCGIVKDQRSLENVGEIRLSGC